MYAGTRLGPDVWRFGGSGNELGPNNRPCDTMGDMAADNMLVV